MSKNSEAQLLRLAKVAATAGGVAGAASLVLALGGEIVVGDDFMGTPAAAGAGWLGYLGAVLLVVGLAGFLVRFVRALPGGAVIAVVALLFATAMTVGSSATLALIVPALTDVAPEMATNPPAVVPATFILSGAVMGICGLVIAAGLRQGAAWLPRATLVLLIAGSVVAILPLPSRFFLLSFAIAVLIGVRDDGRASVREPDQLSALG